MQQFVALNLWYDKTSNKSYFESIGNMLPPSLFSSVKMFETFVLNINDVD